MDHLHVRCPSCAKLYQIDVARIFSSAPEFKCVSCATKFCFDFPPEDPLQIKTRAVLESVQVASRTRKCPRCAGSADKQAKECPSCGVIFEKVEGLPADRSLKAQPSLVRRWKDVLEDYSNEDLHREFLMACQSREALSYARHQYREIKTLQGEDEIADRMLAQVEALGSVKRSLKDMRKTEAAAPVATTWMRLKAFLIFVPYVVGFLLVLFGLSPMGPRNMIGVGMAVLLLSYGLLPEARQIFVRRIRQLAKKI